MAAPERFAEMPDSSCNAGVVHTWHEAGIFGTANEPVRLLRSKRADRHLAGDAVREALLTCLLSGSFQSTLCQSLTLKGTKPLLRKKPSAPSLHDQCPRRP